MVADVGDDGPWDGIDGEPVVMVQDLETLNLALKQKREETVVRVRRQPKSELRLRARRVAVEHNLRVPRLQLP